MSRTLVSKVAGVSFEGRQEVIARMRGSEPCRIVPEPTNPYDSNALAVWVALETGERAQVGYVPRDLAELVAPHLDGEQIMVKLLEITGGTDWFPTRGLLIQIEIPEGSEIA
jgi:single-stranded-DNA-specific exonuclease